MGFGHRVYRAYDPRAAALRKVAESMEHKPDWLELAIQVEDVALRVLAERYPDRPLKTNVEYYAAAGAHGRRPDAGPVPGDLRARPARRLDGPRPSSRPPTTGSSGPTRGTSAPRSATCRPDAGRDRAYSQPRRRK